MGWMKEVWRLMHEEQRSYDEAIDIVAAERQQRELEYQELQMSKHERYPEN
tara:strand:- start:1118 stop:1270 length:153 start_codon:yes stop_codon:yes gene_type:complete